MSDVVLCFCGARMRRVESHRGPFYGCSRWPTCTGKVGMHPDGRRLSEDEAHIGKFTKEQCEKLVALLESRRERVATVGEVARRRP